MLDKYLDPDPDEWDEDCLCEEFVDLDDHEVIVELDEVLDRFYERMELKNVQG